MTAVLLDTKGPEIRTGTVEGYVSGEKNLYVDLEDGKDVLVTTDERMKEVRIGGGRERTATTSPTAITNNLTLVASLLPGRSSQLVSRDTIYLDYKQIGSTVTEGDVLLLDDGLIGLQVVSVNDGLTNGDEDYCEVKCVVKNGGGEAKRGEK